MLSFEDIWANRVSNPDNLGAEEKKLWTEIEPILIELLDELKTNRKIEISFSADEKHHLMMTVNNNLTQASKNHNLLLHVFDNAKKFFEVNSEFGLGENDVVNLYVEIAVLLCILHTELFKTLLLFHLKGVNHKASNFNSTMGQFAPTAWRKLKPYVDNEFRNSLAHGTWAVENKEIVLFEDAKFVIFEKLSLDEFMIRTKKQNVLFVCLANVLAEKHKANVFT